MTATANVKNINVYAITEKSFDIYLDYTLPTFHQASDTISFSMDVVGDPGHADVGLLSEYDPDALSTMDSVAMRDLYYTII